MLTIFRPLSGLAKFRGPNMQNPTNASMSSRMGYFARLICVCAVNMGMRASRLDAMRPRESAPSKWIPDAALGKRIIDEAHIHMTMQAKVKLPSGAICGFEAFASPELDGERIPADIFVEAIFAAKAQSAFDWRVLEEGFKFAGAQGPRSDAPISFNVSPVTMADEGFAERLFGLATKHGASLSGMRIEVLEKMPLSVSEQASMRGEISKASKAGFRFSIDDFGSGDADCGMLTLPAEELKIDAFYVRSLSDPHGERWITAIVRLAKSHGMSVCAEGVEHAWQADILSRLGVDVGQGYFWHKPAAALEAFALSARKEPAIDRRLAQRRRSLALPEARGSKKEPSLG